MGFPTSFCSKTILVILVPYISTWILESAHQFPQKQKKSAGILIKTLKSVDQFGENYHLNIKSSNPWTWNAFPQWIQIFGYKFCAHFVKFIPKYLTLFFDATGNGTVFLFHFDCSLLVSRNTIHFYTLNLVSGNLTKFI